MGWGLVLPVGFVVCAGFAVYFHRARPLDTFVAAALALGFAVAAAVIAAMASRPALVVIYLCAGVAAGRMAWVASDCYIEGQVDQVRTRDREEP